MSAHKRFPRASRLRRGYHVKQVDAFLDRVETSLNGMFPPMAAADIRRAGFELVHHGYAIGAVDEHLDRLEERVLVVQSAAGGRRARNDGDSDAAFLRDELDTPYMRRFPRAGLLRRGYEVDAVDDLVDRVLAALSEADDLTAEDIRATSFAAKRGGYSEETVDETLDRVVEVLLVRHRSGGTGIGLRPSAQDTESAGPTR